MAGEHEGDPGRKTGAKQPCEVGRHGRAGVAILDRKARGHGARRLADIICDSMDRLSEAIAALDKRNGVLELAARVTQLENEADRVHQDAIVELFDNEQNPITVIGGKKGALAGAAIGGGAASIYEATRRK